MDVFDSDAVGRTCFLTGQFGLFGSIKLKKYGVTATESLLFAISKPLNFRIC